MPFGFHFRKCERFSCEFIAFQGLSDGKSAQGLGRRCGTFQGTASPCAPMGTQEPRLGHKWEHKREHTWEHKWEHKWELKWKHKCGLQCLLIPQQMGAQMGTRMGTQMGTQIGTQRETQVRVTVPVNPKLGSTRNTHDLFCVPKSGF